MDDNELSTAQNNQKTAPVILLIFSFLAALITFLIMLFGFQKGLPVAERCHCSMSKVYLFTGASFLSVMVQFICYHTDTAYCKQFEGLDVSDWLNSHAITGKKKSISKILIAVFMGAGIEFFLLPFLTDQNTDFLWFFHHGPAGILCFILTLLVNAVGALIVCIGKPYRQW